MNQSANDAGLAWQVGVWDKMSEIYQREIDARFTPVIERLLAYAKLQPDESVLDLGTGTGSVAFAAAAQVGTAGRITAVDISHEMLAKAKARAADRSIDNIRFEEGRGEAPGEAAMILVSRSTSTPFWRSFLTAYVARSSLVSGMMRALECTSITRMSSGRMVG